MNSLWNIKRPKYQVIADIYEDAFEQSLWETYARQCSDKHLRFYLPIISDDLILAEEGIHPEVFASSYLNFLHEDPLYFAKATHHMDDAHRYAFSKHVVADFERKPNHIFDEVLYEDVKSMLSRHYLSYMDIAFSIQDRRLGYKNLPVVEVW